MKTFLAACLIAAATAAPGLAIAKTQNHSNLFTEFSRLCIETRAQPEKVKELYGNWAEVKDMPASVQSMYGGPFKTGEYRVSSGSDDARLIAHGIKEGGGGEARVCALSGPLDSTAHEAAAKWAGPNVKIIGDGKAFSLIMAYEEPTGKRTPTKEEASSLEPAVASHIVGMMVAEVNEETSILMLTVPIGH